MEDLLKQAKIFFRRRQFESSIALLRQVLKQDPASGEAWLGLGLALVCSGSTTEGIEALKKAQKCDPHNPTAYRAVATVLQAAGHVKEAITYLEVAALFAPVIFQAEIHLSLATLCACLGNRERVRLELQLLATMALVEPRKQLALYQEIHDVDALESFVQKLSGEIKILGQAVLLEEKTMSQQAAEIYIQLSAAESEMWEVYEYLARMYWNLKESRTGRMFMDKAIQLAPQTAKVQLSNSLYHSQKNPAEAKERLQQLALFPGVFASIREEAKQQLEILAERY